MKDPWPNSPAPDPIAFGYTSFTFTLINAINGSTLLQTQRPDIQNQTGMPFALCSNSAAI
jgi:hypothetical protein